MCGRFTDMFTWEEIYRYYSLIGETPTNWGPDFNVCPTDEVGLVVPRDCRRGFERMRWGLIPRWWPRALKELRLATFNARAETVRRNPIFREAFKDSRSLMPVSGYYEWHDANPADKKEKPQPYYFTRRDGNLMTAAALCDSWRDRSENRTIRSCTMIITEPNVFVGQIHDRMPVVLEKVDFDQWMFGTPDQAAELLKPAGEDVLKRWPVSKRINSSRTPKDDSALIDPVHLAM